VNTTSSEIKITNIEYIPSLQKYLILLRATTNISNIFFFLQNYCYILDAVDLGHEPTTGHGVPTNGLYSFGQIFEANTIATQDKVLLWHQHFGHLSS
jgi:hypothetical protein